MPDKYSSMTALYADPLNVEGTTYGKRWRRHEWIQLAEAQATDNPEAEKIVLAIHGGGIEGGTSEVALAVAGYHPATFAQSTDRLGVHDLWIFEGLLSSGNSDLHVTSTNYDDPIALALVKNARRCISLHGFSDADANGQSQIGGLDTELKSIVLEELTVAGIPAHIATDPELNGSNPANICNRTTTGAGVQLEMGTTYRASLFAPNCNTRELRKNNTNAAFWNLVGALRNALSRVY
jgi:phage replication-related protein YjqB (UPF0714/DUF867 family)